MSDLSFEALRRQVDAQRIRLFVSDGELRYTAPEGAMTEELRRALRAHRPQLIRALAAEAEAPDAPPALVADPDNRHRPYPMSDLQRAYWVGEHGGYAQSAVPCFFHHCRLDPVAPQALEAALAALQHRHEVLRARFFADGTQVIPPPGENPCRAGLEDLSALEPDEAERRLRDLRHAFPDTLPRLEDGPPLAATLVLMPGSQRLLLALRLIAIDGPSLSMIFADLLRFLYDGAAAGPPPALSHRDYILALPGTRSRHSEDYWARTLPELPPAPRLPVTGANPQWSRFRRLAGHLDAAPWARLKATAAAHGVTANAVMLALYASALRRHAEEPRFTLNVLANHRPFSHPELARMTGNCSNTTLIDCAGAGDFLAQAQALQALMAERVSHAGVSGVSLLRRLQQDDPTGTPAVPFVFTSGIGGARAALPPHLASRFALLDSHLRTPQVWMDHQVIEGHDGLIYYWDYVEDIFEDGLPEAVFRHYEQALGALVAAPAAWQRFDPAEPDVPALAPLVPGPASDREGTLAEGFLAQAQATPERTALIPADGPALSYAGLRDAAGRLAASFAAAGAQPGEIIALQLPKGTNQIAGVVAAALAGLVYLPLDARLPPARRDAILAHAGCRWLLAGAGDAPPDGVRRLDPGAAWGEGPAPAFAPVPRRAGDRAYVIYTSGSTGTPKGVVIAHGAALNTIRDVNRRMGIGPGDRLLALSALTFDLSVYDIWGALTCGAALALPPETPTPDPEAIARTVAEAGATVWNSAPAYLEMVLAASRDPDCRALSGLRVIMLSGDWISLPLARRVRALFPQAAFYSLGGATEASIWSNVYPVTDVPPEWTSVPYGFALAGQQLHVLDAAGRPCPTGVRGEIHIEGHGLAEGYLNDPARTAESFIRHQSGRRLYRTGDLGRMRRDGAVEFLGRRDFQLKIRGFRVEPGEIEAHLSAHPAIDQVEVLALDGPGGRLLAACHTGAPVADAELAHWLGARLPKYMVPDLFLPFAAFPLNASGKRDRRAIRAEAETRRAATGTAPAGAAGMPDEMRALAQVWAQVLGTPPATADDNFFQSGGNSLTAVHLAAAVRARFGVEISLAELFHKPRLGEVWRLVAARGAAPAPHIPCQETP